MFIFHDQPNAEFRNKKRAPEIPEPLYISSQSLNESKKKLTACHIYYNSSGKIVVYFHRKEDKTLFPGTVLATQRNADSSSDHYDKKLVRGLGLLMKNIQNEQN